jgi:hypothetical protein
MFLILSLVLSGTYEVWGGTNASNSPKAKKIYNILTAYLTELYVKMFFALQVKKPAFLPTVREQTLISV